MKKVIIIGAGPAGLTAACELLSRSGEYEVTVLEERGDIGGISRTACRNGNRIDLGGHRFFSKVPEVNAWWERMLPAQGSPSRDETLPGSMPLLQAGGPDPEREDRVMLRRRRKSRIFYHGGFIDYPVHLNREMLRTVGAGTGIAAGFSYLKSAVFRRRENSLEDFYINRFGEKLYRMFFEQYTEKLWGRHPSRISPDWGAQRVRGLSVRAVLKNRNGDEENSETSLITSFSYPKLGAGQMWEQAAAETERMGGTILRNTKVTGICTEGGSATGVNCEKDGKRFRLDGDYVISSMPLKDLIAGMEEVPETIREVAEGLPYRNMIVVGILTGPLALPARTGVRARGNLIPDQWIYLQDSSVKAGRIQIYNNWSPYMVRDPEHTVWMGLEYFCGEDDPLWRMTDGQLAQLAAGELVRLGFILSEDEVKDSCAERVDKAYPAYFDTYGRIGEVQEFLNRIPNLFCIGRNGQHRYNNMDHSMCTAFEAVRCILEGNTDKSALWAVNTEREYHEAK